MAFFKLKALGRLAIGFVRHTVSNDDPTPWVIQKNRQATVHGELILDGDVFLDDNAQLVIEA